VYEQPRVVETGPAKSQQVKEGVEHFKQRAGENIEHFKQRAGENVEMLKQKGMEGYYRAKEEFPNYRGLALAIGISVLCLGLLLGFGIPAMFPKHAPPKTTTEKIRDRAMDYYGGVKGAGSKMMNYMDDISDDLSDTYHGIKRKVGLEKKPLSTFDKIKAAFHAERMKDKFEDAYDDMKEGIHQGAKWVKVGFNKMTGRYEVIQEDEGFFNRLWNRLTGVEEPEFPEDEEIEPGLLKRAWFKLTGQHLDETEAVHPSVLKKAYYKMTGRDLEEEEEVERPGLFKRALYALVGKQFGSTRYHPNEGFFAKLQKWLHRFELISALGTSAYTIWACSTLLWIVSLFKKDASIMDSFWGLGFVIVSWTYFFALPGLFRRKLLICALTTIWGLRLSSHLLARNWNKPEDFRYNNMRQKYGDNFWWISYFNVFLLQGFLLWLISAPLMMAQREKNIEGHLLMTDYLGVIVWAIGFYIETMADYELTQFKKEHGTNSDQFLNQGLWKYSRHPNHFGDALVWCGFFLIACGAPDGFWSIFSPILMTYLLRSISGVPAIDNELLRKKAGYQEYLRNTNAFFPWFSKAEMKFEQTGYQKVGVESSAYQKPVREQMYEEVYQPQYQKETIYKENLQSGYQPLTKDRETPVPLGVNMASARAP
jgi:steroid 5-alpha reductase family enzyme